MFAAIVRWFRAAWEYILQWLWCSSKDPRSSSNDDFESKEQLLGPHGISSTPVAQEQATAAVAEAAREGNTTAPALADTTIIVMRHGHRWVVMAVTRAFVKACTGGIAPNITVSVSQIQTMFPSNCMSPAEDT